MPVDLAAAICQALPDAAAATLTMLPGGWDSQAVSVGGVRVCKFPKSAAALARLRREVAILDALAGRVTLPIPRMRMIAAARPFTVHAMLQGAHLLPRDYPALDEIAKATLAADLARFHAELHDVPAETMRAAGAGPIQSWGDPRDVLAAASPLLPKTLVRSAERVMRDWSALDEDREIYGFFDGHGWNMAFDHASGRLNGIYDFADSGFGPLHRDFVPSGFVAADLTRRLIAAYSALTGTRVEPGRVHIVTGMLRLWELASAAAQPGDIPGMLANFHDWARSSHPG